jgi:hypothetical protein
MIAEPGCLPRFYSSEGRGDVVEVDAYLSQGNTRLPTAGGIITRVQKSIWVGAFTRMLIGIIDSDSFQKLPKSPKELPRTFSLPTESTA